MPIFAPPLTVPLHEIDDTTRASIGLLVVGQITGLPWRTWSPTYTNLTIGNGVVVARYSRIGDLVVAVFELVFGSTTTVDGAGPTVSLPVTAASTYTFPRHGVGAAYVHDTGTAVFTAQVRLESSTTFSVGVHDATATHLTHAGIAATVPMTWTTNDLLSFTATYEAA